MHRITTSGADRGAWGWVSARFASLLGEEGSLNSMNYEEVVQVLQEVTYRVVPLPSPW